MIEVGIVGGTGYTGVELLRVLVNHPQVRVKIITSRAEAGLRVDELYTSLRGFLDLQFSEPDLDALASCDVVFFATPHGVAQNMMPALLERGVRVVDLSADFRIRDARLWSDWYGQEHGCPELLPKAVYGLPEVNRQQIASAQLVACPGCYPTAIQLGFIPLLENNLVDASDLVADAASGVSGAGRQAKVANLLAEVSDSFKAYGAAGHRHLPEIEQGLGDVLPAGSGEVGLTFVPHLVPMIRGIHATLYANLNGAAADLQQVFEERYASEPFVDVMPAGSHPETRTVKSSNMCRIAVFQPQQRGKVVVLSVIDNLAKGASGQAVQNMNIMFGFDERAGLNQVAVLP
ncbi:N-acetyl-gamma-glutamyl-phosphate reductase [Pseudomaricurvus alcaniphilus]|uniref:N-acetyl-gamma-glutamyl-phosphate reductase n=1 Tax=Pseudomaricurvus alcaniphilus TaxID=1166482 RepID=UPI001409BC85|nr:N-acetyl-gamma-glutamyl-phosphate reductase [Pseudomaricurvus alcaniphilus]